MLKLPPLSLYIHFPWCVRKCPYCDFNSHTLKNSVPEDHYINQLITDLNRDLSYIQGRKLHSIFMGGGTPSLFSPEAIKKLLEHIARCIDFAEDIEITLEANPGTVEQQHFQGYLKAQVNRLSLGIQSFSAGHLKALGRIHGGEEARNAVIAAQKSGFKNINLDLMFGLPQQNLSEALADLNQALSFNTPHLSWYQLTLEPNTFFYKHPPSLPEHDEIAAIHEAGIALLQKRGFEHYEISAFAQDGFECRHNQNYWTYGDYLGIGAGAHSKLSVVTENKVIRQMKFKHPKTYLEAQNHFIQTEERVTPAERVFEFMLNALRLHKPVRFEEFEARTALSRQHLHPALEKADKNDLVIISNEALTTTAKGKLFLNDLVEMFLDE